MQQLVGGIIGVVVTGLFAYAVQRAGSKANLKIEQIRSGNAETAQGFEVLKSVIAELRAELARVTTKSDLCEERVKELEGNERRRTRGGHAKET